MWGIVWGIVFLGNKKGLKASLKVLVFIVVAGARFELTTFGL
jgi:hypothetical protein